MNRVAIFEDGGGDHGGFLGEVYAPDTLLQLHALDRGKTCQWLRNLLHQEGKIVSI